MAITKTGNVLTSAGKFLMKDSGYLTSAMGLGLGAMSVTGGMNSVGGEVAGGVTGLAASNLASGAMKAMGLGKYSWLGNIAGGMYGYGKGSAFANKYSPIYKRGEQTPTPQVTSSQQLNLTPKVNNTAHNFQQSQSPSYTE